MVEGARLESVYAGDRIVGSNPILSANYKMLDYFHGFNLIKITFIEKLYRKFKIHNIYNRINYRYETIQENN